MDLLSDDEGRVNDPMDDLVAQLEQMESKR